MFDSFEDVVTDLPVPVLIPEGWEPNEMNAKIFADYCPGEDYPDFVRVFKEVHEGYHSDNWDRSFMAYTVKVHTCGRAKRKHEQTSLALHSLRAALSA